MATEKITPPDSGSIKGHQIGRNNPFELADVAHPARHRSLGNPHAKAQELILEYCMRRVQAIVAHRIRQQINNLAGFIIRVLEHTWQKTTSHEDRAANELVDDVVYALGKYADFAIFMVGTSNTMWALVDPYNLL